MCVSLSGVRAGPFGDPYFRYQRGASMADYTRLHGGGRYPEYHSFNPDTRRRDMFPGYSGMRTFSEPYTGQDLSVQRFQQPRFGSPRTFRQSGAFDSRYTPTFDGPRDRIPQYQDSFDTRSRLSDRPFDPRGSSFRAFTSNTWRDDGQYAGARDGRYPGDGSYGDTWYRSGGQYGFAQYPTEGQHNEYTHRGNSRRVSRHEVSQQPSFPRARVDQWRGTRSNSNRRSDMPTTRIDRPPRQQQAYDRRVGVTRDYQEPYGPNVWRQSKNGNGRIQIYSPHTNRRQQSNRQIQGRQSLRTPDFNALTPDVDLNLLPSFSGKRNEAVQYLTSVEPVPERRRHSDSRPTSVSNPPLQLPFEPLSRRYPQFVESQRNKQRASSTDSATNRGSTNRNRVAVPTQQSPAANGLSVNNIRYMLSIKNDNNNLLDMSVSREQLITDIQRTLSLADQLNIDLDSIVDDFDKPDDDDSKNARIQASDVDIFLMHGPFLSDVIVDDSNRTELVHHNEDDGPIYLDSDVGPDNVLPGDIPLTDAVSIASSNNNKTILFNEISTLDQMQNVSESNIEAPLSEPNLLSKDNGGHV